MTSKEALNGRLDYQIIYDMIDEKSEILDLGCGDGKLLSLMIDKKSCRGAGIEIDEMSVYQCFERGLTVTHEDIGAGLKDYSDKRFDYVILNESLQQILHPQEVILESFRIGKNVIVGIPNFCHWAARLQIFFRGRVPITEKLPYEWFNTPNLRFFSLKDFRTFCKINHLIILKEKYIGNKRTINFLPNMFANIGIFLLTK